MGIKIKQSPKPVNDQKKRVLKQKGGGKKSVVPKQVKNASVETNKTAESTMESKKEVPKCELNKEQVKKAVEAAFKAQEFCQKKGKSSNLFEEDPEPIYLLVSSFKIPSEESKLLKTVLPNSFRNEESDICLIVKDLEKGWKIGHEPTTHHYQELLDSKNVKGIKEIMPLRQLRVEYKPFEARIKLSKLYDLMLVDHRAIKFVPRYFGKAFYQSGKFPISIDLGAEDLEEAMKQALATTVMPLTNKGTSTQVQVGLSTQDMKMVADNIVAVYQNMLENFPGKFSNVRSLTLRFGNSEWTVPIYVSYASRNTAQVPKAPKAAVALVDDLTTLAPGWKVAVYPSGEVKKVKDENYKRTAMDEADNPQQQPKKRKNAKSAKKGGKVPKDDSDDEEEEESEDETPVKKIKHQKEKKKTNESDSDEDEASEVEEDVISKTKPQQKTKKKAADAADSSDDEGDVLEEEYMMELDLLEEKIAEQVTGPVVASPEVKKTTKKKEAPKKKQTLKKKGKQSA